MSVVQMRTILKERTKYKNSPKWWTKVDSMSDQQVIAVYCRMSKAGELK